MNGFEAQMTSCKRDIVNSIRKNFTVGDPEATPTVKSYSEEFQLAKHKRLSFGSQYIKRNFIAVTSASVERAFSAARWILTCLRKKLSPILLETILFLKLICHMWDMSLVLSAIKLKYSERYEKDCAPGEDAFYDND